MLRFVGLRWTPIDREGERQGRALIVRLEQSGQWTRIIDWRGFVLMVMADERDLTPLLLAGERGAIVGTLFSRTDEAHPPARFDETAAADLAEDGGEKLVAHYWGGYVAVLIDRGRDLIHVIRDPTGARTCFHARHGEVNVFFSHAQDYALLSGALTPDLDYVAGFLLNAGLTTRRTGIAGVSDLQAGERVTYSRHAAELSWLWRPDTIEEWGGDFAEAGRALRRTAAQCVGAWGRSSPKTMLRLSGGLDSSIVLGLLAREASQSEIICVNEYSDVAPEGDERAFARLAAKRHGRRLVELPMRPDVVHYERALDAPLTASPSLSLLSFADRTLADTAEGLNAQLIVSGQAGDHLFQRNRTPLIAADAVRDHLPARECLRIGLDVARLSGRSIWEVAAAMVRHGVLRQKLPFAPLIARAASLVAADVPRTALVEWAAHDWTENARTMAPARALRIWHLIDALRYHAPSVLNCSIRCAPVLLSQPIVELCLSIPTYRMVEGGRDRALARSAFADLLPPEIARRALKGETTRYFAAVLERNFAFMRDHLLDGELHRHRLINRPRLEAALERGMIAEGVIADGLMSCLAAEIWLRNLARASRA